MEARGAFPGWLNRVWWVLMPGALVLAAGVVAFLPYLLGGHAEQKATGLAAVGGGAGIAVFWVVGSWLLVSLALMNVWFFVAAGFAWRKDFDLQRGERWKLAGAVGALMLVYSPLLLVLMGKLMLAMRRLVN